MLMLGYALKLQINRIILVIESLSVKSERELDLLSFPRKRESGDSAKAVVDARLRGHDDHVEWVSDATAMY
ncbi:hypothetical protein [Nitrosomonas sp.]|uniref:hypothetical protein n=1 Tax=Nitrosomonas sp. TaxID=42353 RepID=UPI001DA0DF84|nr:hypothetical protein [Nitrosomonas sp.]MBX3617732.1 hypothetical protein [Nitrosomonas sp.]